MLARNARNWTFVSNVAELTRETARAISCVQEVLASLEIRDASGPTLKPLFRTLDGAFMALFDLYEGFRHRTEPVLVQQAATIQAALISLNRRFAPVGWQSPKGSVEGHERMATAEKSGALVLSTSEKGALGQLHLRAAQQYLLDSWSEIAAGRYSTVATVARELRSGTNLLLDPKVASEARAAAADVQGIEPVLERVITYVEANDKKSLPQLAELAAATDGARKLVGQSPRWAARLSGDAPSVAGGSVPAPQSDKNGVPISISNEVDRGPARAEPPEDRIKAMKTFIKRVHIEDTNYDYEYLGYVELTTLVCLSEGGQIYVKYAKARPVFDGRAGQYLSVAGELLGTSIRLNGERFADIIYDIQICGPQVTATDVVAASGKVAASNGDKSKGGEVGVNISFSNAVSSKATRSVRRVFRFHNLDTPVELTLSRPNGSTYKELVAGLVIEEQRDQRADFSGWEIDDDDVGDTLTTFYANWILNSYSDD
ncbi:MAG: hypothetical protein KF773_12360 [Deltaproteobacteria bacterium]|nr:hypothetical protein [Deltaproteobacteria bacterium]